jgi:hypothetical protein
LFRFFYSVASRRGATFQRHHGDGCGRGIAIWLFRGGDINDRLGQMVGAPRAFGMLGCHSPSAILCLPALVSRSSPGNSSMYPSWISRSLCSGGIVRCIGPLAQLRSDTNSSWVSGGTDEPCAIPQICARNRPFSSNNPRHNQTDPLPAAEGPCSLKMTSAASSSSQERARVIDHGCARDQDATLRLERAAAQDRKATPSMLTITARATYTASALSCLLRAVRNLRNLRDRGAAAARSPLDRSPGMPNVRNHTSTPCSPPTGARAL